MNFFNKKYLKPIIFFSVLSSILITSFTLNSLTKNLYVEELLDKLQYTNSPMTAESIRKKIWDEWIYDVPKKYQKKLNFALSEFYSGNLLSSEKEFTKLINEIPWYIEGWNKRATIRFMLNDLEGSLQDIDKVLELQPRHFGAISGSGLIYMKKKQYKNALKVYLLLNKIDPMNTDSKNFIKFLKKIINENSV